MNKTKPKFLKRRLSFLRRKLKSRRSSIRPKIKKVY